LVGPWGLPSLLSSADLSLSPTLISLWNPFLILATL